MAAKVKRGLGKGLDAIIPVSENAVSEKAASEKADNKGAETIVRITQVEPNREQPRKNFDEDALQELADSSSLDCCSRFWCRTEKPTMKS